MKRLMQRLWNDEGGFILSTEAMILWTITVLGLIVGLAAVRDAAVTELIEVANTILTFDQSYQYATLSLTNQPQGSAPSNNPGDSAFTSGSAAQDSPGTNLNGTGAPYTWYGVVGTNLGASPMNAPGTISVVAP
jgi:hypothetical protein